MKKYYYFYVAAILAMIMTLPSVTRAEEGSDDATVNRNSSVQTSLPPMPRPGVKPMTPLERLRAAKNQNIQNNEDSRNRMLVNLKTASGTPEDRRAIKQGMRDDLKDIREQGREYMKNASSSGERREIRRDMRREEFQVRKEALMKQLGITLKNLKQIRERISSRIDKVSAEGRNMSEAKKLLVIADAKIILAEQAINAFVSLNPNATSTVSASSTIDLNKPRQVGATAIQALKDAHRALVAVIVSIAHNMGRGNATSTPPTTPPVTATTTATTTPPTATTTNQLIPSGETGGRNNTTTQ